MRSRSKKKTRESHHDSLWRDPAQVASQWEDARRVDPALLKFVVRGKWWETLDSCRIVLLITREYEHLVMSAGIKNGKPHVSYFALPHPSGLVVDRLSGVVHIASTRNPNQVFDFLPVAGSMRRLDVKSSGRDDSVLIPIRSRFYPGCLYLHDLAFIGGKLHGNSVGQNAIVSLDETGQHRRVWWPRCIEAKNGPVFGQNQIQLNSIAAGRTLSTSYYTASSEIISRRRPGHRNFPVDKRGVIFSGATREPIARGFTRPHSARLFEKQIWVDNSGYGEFGFVQDNKFLPVASLPGWTRGLCFAGGVAFVGTSRVIDRFRHYAPGLDPDECECGIHAIDVSTGAIVGSMIWPQGNQVFAIDWLPEKITSGFPFGYRTGRSDAGEKALFYSFRSNLSEDRK